MRILFFFFFFARFRFLSGRIANLSWHFFADRNQEGNQPWCLDDPTFETNCFCLITPKGMISAIVTP